MSRLPSWIRMDLHTDRHFARVGARLASDRLHTVCRSARCPNRHECWNRGTATFMILGDICTRACAFCAVSHGQPVPPDAGEPERVARAAADLHLRHVVITSVTRDDLPDGGAALFAETIRAIRRTCAGATIEVLTPDFQGAEAALVAVLAAAPDVFNHNLETVERLQPVIRPQASYTRSLAVLRFAADYSASAHGNRPGPAVKSGLMVGLGETDNEVRLAMRDLRAAGCDLLTIGQYLAPTDVNHPVRRFVTPAEFDAYRDAALAMGFKGVAAGPLVRSSYRAEDLAGVRRISATAPT